MGRYPLFLLLILFTYGRASSQDLSYARQIVQVLAAPEMYGRGYQHDGDRKAAAFIREEFRKHGLQPVGEDYFQPVIFPVNSITGRTYCAIDGKELIPGSDYYISARTKGTEGTYTLVWVDHEKLKKKRQVKRLVRTNHREHVMVIDPRVVEDTAMKGLYQSIFWNNLLKAGGMIRLQDKPGWHISDSGAESDYLVLTIRKDKLSRKSRQVAVRFNSHFEPCYESNNVIAMVEGKEYPDSFIVFTAHYDHLGMMGDVVIPGANDNASGTAMILDLARHYAANPPRWSVVFIAFTGEEAGLIGSRHFTENPMIPLENIALLVNFDMVGTGSEGITMVNGAVFKEDFRLLDSLNRVYRLVEQVKARGESPNSDHHPFYAKGVKAFFIYTMGKEFTEYHNIYDRPEDLPLTAYKEVFVLISRFADQYMR